MPALKPAALRPWLAMLLAVALLASAYLPLATNPGWFSHDELQWGLAAQVERVIDLPWVPWAATETFQWRPLTFNLWLLLAWGSFETPVAMHALWVALGSVIGGLLFLCLRTLGINRGPAAAGGIAFMLNPFAVYVHGWTATLAELLWVGCGLALALVVLRAERVERIAPALAGMALTSLALLSKESALAIAPLLALAWWLSGRERRWLAATLGSSLPTVIYLALRLPVLLFEARPDDSYHWSIANLPLRWAEMQLWPFLVTSFEFGGVERASATRLLLATAIAISLLGCAFRAGRRSGFALILGGALAIGPAVVLAAPYPQYGYAYSVLVAACLTRTWAALHPPGRAVVLLAAALTTWHGFNVQREMRRVGELEVRFTPALESILRDQGFARLRPTNSADVWLYARLSVAYAGHYPDSARVIVTLDQADATHSIQNDGRIVPVP